MNSPIIEILGQVPAEPTLMVLPGADVTVVQELDRALGGRSRVVWMVENTLRPSTEVMRHLQESGSAGFFTALEQSGAEPVVGRVQQALEAGRHVVFLTGAVEPKSAVAEGIPGHILSFADQTPLAAMPLYVSMQNERLENAWVNQAPYRRLRIHFLPLQRAGAALGVRLREAWRAAAAEELLQHPLVQKPSIAHALLKSMLAHPDAEIIDGVDDSRISYRHVLACALLLCRRLQRYTASRRIGIILPPGKRSIIANLACMLAGISPVNVDYTASEESFRQLCGAAGIDRFISSENFVHKQQDFAWPNLCDIIFIDREIHTLGARRLRAWKLLSNWGGKSFVVSRIGLEEPNPDSEAMLAFAQGTDGTCKLLPYTHKGMMAALRQEQKVLELKGTDTALCAMPMSHAAVLVPQFLLPLLLGMNIVTYPSPTSSKRLAELIFNNRVSYTCFMPQEATALLEQAGQEQFHSMRQFVLADDGSAPLPTEAMQRLHLPVSVFKGIPEFILPLSIMKLGALVADKPARVQERFYPMPGVTLRMLDLSNPTQLSPAEVPGIVTLCGPTLVRAALSGEAAQVGYYSTDELGYADADGALNLMGNKDTFCKVKGELVPLLESEVVLRRLLKIDPADTTRRIALVAMPIPQEDSAELVLLSTVHKRVIANDAVSLYYSYINEKVPTTWAPKRILPVQGIPLMPDGSVNYELCRNGIQRMLKPRA